MAEYGRSVYHPGVTEPADQTAAGAGTPPVRFLVLDTHDVLRGLLRPALESNSAVAMHFVSTLAAWERTLAGAAGYDFLIIDWDACEGAGVALLHALCQQARLRDASVLVLASELTDELSALGPLYRVAAFVTKPFTVASVAAAIRNELGSRLRPDRLEVLLSRAWRLMDEGAAPKALLVYQWLDGRIAWARPLGEACIEVGDELRSAIEADQRNSDLHRLR